MPRSGPPPSPLKLEAAAGPRSTAFEALRLAGRAHLRLLAAVTSWTRYPWDDAGMLAQRMASLVGKDRRAALLRASGFPPRDGPGAGPITERVASGILEALVGAYALELGGDLLSICRAWHWLTGSDEFAPAVPRVAATGPRFYGRTPTYVHFRGLLRDGVPTLEVHYQESGVMLYQRPSLESGGVGAELMPEVPDAAWRDLSFDPEAGTFTSAHLLQPDHRAVPSPARWSTGFGGHPCADWCP